MSRAAKLTREQREAIRRDGRIQIVIAAEYGISQQRVSDIKTGRRRTTEQRRAEGRKQYERNRERAITNAARWAAAHPEKRREICRRYDATTAAKARARRRRMGDDCTDYVAILDGDPCSYCGAPSAEADHIDPLARGGATVPDNLTAACRSCNARKRAKPLLIFLVERMSGA